MAGKVISVSSVKGGVGKTTMLLNLAGIYSNNNKKVLIIDADLFSGGVAVSLNIRNERDIFMLTESISNNRLTELNKYVSHYNNNIDVLASPKDPREAIKIENRYIPLVLNMACREYEIVLVDTSHILSDINLTILDYSYMTLMVITNDIVDLKNMRSLINIFNESGKKNYLVVLNNARDTGKDYMTLYDIRKIIQNNVDYTISKNYYIKNIDKYIINGEILTLNSRLNSLHFEDVQKMKRMAFDLISDKHSKEENSNG